MDLFLKKSRRKDNFLNDDQNAALDLVSTGNSILITGEAGTGKSYIIQKIIDQCNKIDRIVAVTAMTGTAASLIGGKTVHSWGSLGIGNRSAEYYSEKILGSWPKKIKWRKCRVLIIDEISMMDANFFELIEKVARLVRGNNRPFGGMQVILIGDFYQLPPVSKSNEPLKFCFESEKWNEVIQNKITLREIVRQKDPIFQNVLSEVRIGKPSIETIKIIESRVNVKPDTDSGIVPTILHSKRNKVDKINEIEFNKLPTSQIVEYNADYEITGDKAIKMKKDELTMWVDLIDKDNNYVKTLQLAIGAQVMLLVNLDQEIGLVNGSRGIIIDFEDGFPLVRFLNGNIQKIIYHSYNYEISLSSEIIARQIPLNLAWCSTIHKSQGQSLDYVQINIGSDIFACGQTYVAISRARSLSGLFIEDFDRHKILVNQKVVEFDAS